MPRHNLHDMTPEEKLDNLPGWIDAILANAMRISADMNGGHVPPDAAARAAQIAAAFGLRRVVEIDDPDSDAVGDNLG